jgi:hypothetical protein
MAGSMTEATRAVRTPLDDITEFGIAMLPGLLSTQRVEAINAAIDAILEEEGQPEGLNMFQAAFRAPEILELVCEEAALDLMVNHLGYNLQLASSVLSVRRPAPDPNNGTTFAGRNLPKAGSTTTRLNWHRDGPSPRFPWIDTYSAKVAFVLSDLSQPDHGNTKVVPGSHLRRDFAPDSGEPDEPIPGEMQVLARPGDAYAFTQNIWHAAPTNASRVERRVIFIGYSSLWARPLDYDKAPAHLLENAGPVLRQLLGQVGPTTLHYFMPESMPLMKYWRGPDPVHSYA